MAESILDDIFAGADGVAKGLINLLGADAAIYLPVSETYDPLDGTRTGGGLDDGTAIDLSMMQPANEKDLKETAVLAGDYKAITPSSDIVLERAHIQKAQVEINSKRYTLIHYSPIYSGQEICAYKMFLRSL